MQGRGDGRGKRWGRKKSDRCDRIATPTLRLHGDLPHGGLVASRLLPEGLCTSPVVRITVVSPEHDGVVVAARHQQGDLPCRVPPHGFDILRVFLGRTVAVRSGCQRLRESRNMRRLSSFTSSLTKRSPSPAYLQLPTAPVLHLQSVLGSLTLVPPALCSPSTIVPPRFSPLPFNGRCAKPV